MGEPKTTAGDTTGSNTTAGDAGAPSPSAHEPPSAPLVRSISPAPQDFENPPPQRHLLWPIFWCAIGAMLVLALTQTYRDSGWPVPEASEHGTAQH